MSLRNQSFFVIKSIILLQKWVQPLQRRLQSVHEAHRAGLQPREAREIRPDEVKQQTKSKSKQFQKMSYSDASDVLSEVKL